MGNHLPDESESSAFSCVTISGYVNITNFTTSLEYTTQIFGSRAVREVVHFQRHHAVYARRRSSVTHFDVISIQPQQCTTFAIVSSNCNKWTHTNFTNHRTDAMRQREKANMKQIWRPDVIHYSREAIRDA